METTTEGNEVRNDVALTTHNGEENEIKVWRSHHKRKHTMKMKILRTIYSKRIKRNDKEGVVWMK